MVFQYQPGPISIANFNPFLFIDGFLTALEAMFPYALLAFCVVVFCVMAWRVWERG